MSYQELFRQTSGQGPDLLLVHGWGMHSAVWGEFAEWLAQDFCVTTVDLPGHGHSPAWIGSDMADWSEALLDAAPPRAHWLGWSLGAQLALSAALLRPERIISLCLISANPCFVARPDWRCAMDAAQFAEFYRLVERDGATALTRFAALQSHGLSKPRQAVQQLQGLLQQRPAATPEALLAGLAILRDGDLRAAWPDLSCPTLALFGGNDALVPVGVADALARQAEAARNPLLRVEVLPEAAHQPFLSHNRDCLRRVTAFLQTQRHD